MEFKDKITHFFVILHFEPNKISGGPKLIRTTSILRA